MRVLFAVFLAAVSLSLGGSVQARSVTIAQSFDTETLWPNGTTAAITINPGAAIVEPLFWIDPRDNQFKPLLATSYEMETPTTAIVHLREGVSFTNGEPMNADAVVHSVNIAIDPEKTPAYTLFLAPFEVAEKVDDLTVRIRLKFPYAAIEQALAVIFITPPSYWNEVGLDAFGHKPVGTGPFVFSSWSRDDQLIMTKNEEYWGKLPEGIDTLVWKPIPDDIARVSGLITGEFDIIANIPVSAVPNIKNESGLKLVPVESYRIFFNYLSSIEEHAGPLQDVRVRRALNHAIDKQLLIDTLFMGYAVPTNGQVLRKPQPGFNPDLDDYPYDPEKARALLAEAGYPDGLELTYKVSSGAYAQDSEVPFAIAGMLEKVGVKLNVVVLEGGEYLRQLRAQELQPMGFVGMAPPNDPGIMLSLFHSNWRYPYYKNPELDKLVDLGARELDKDKRAAIYQQAMQIMHDDAAILFLYGAVDFYATSAKIHNFLPGGDGKFVLYGVSADE